MVTVGSHVQYRTADMPDDPNRGWREAIVIGVGDYSLDLAVFLLDLDTAPVRRHVEKRLGVPEGILVGCWRSPLPLSH